LISDYQLLLQPVQVGLETSPYCLSFLDVSEITRK
jgi:hypothetical protein